MFLKLAIVAACNNAGCHVKPLEGETSIEVCFSSLVQDRILIRPAQLVALDMSTNPPEIVWRWLRAAVVELNSDIVVVDDMRGHPANVSYVSALPLKLTLDDEVWVCSTGRAFEVHDIIVDEKPENPERLLEYITPIIFEIYQNVVPA